MRLFDRPLLTSLHIKEMVARHQSGVPESLAILADVAITIVSVHIFRPHVISLKCFFFLPTDDSIATTTSVSPMVNERNAANNGVDTSLVFHELLNEMDPQPESRKEQLSFPTIDTAAVRFREPGSKEPLSPSASVNAGTVSDGVSSVNDNIDDVSPSDQERTVDTDRRDSVSSRRSSSSPVQQGVFLADSDDDEPFSVIAHPANEYSASQNEADGITAHRGNSSPSDGSGAIRHARRLTPASPTARPAPYDAAVRQQHRRYSPPQKRFIADVAPVDARGRRHLQSPDQTCRTEFLDDYAIYGLLYKPPWIGFSLFDLAPELYRATDIICNGPSVRAICQFSRYFVTNN